MQVAVHDKTAKTLKAYAKNHGIGVPEAIDKHVEGAQSRWGALQKYNEKQRRAAKKGSGKARGKRAARKSNGKVK